MKRTTQTQRGGELTVARVLLLLLVLALPAAVQAQDYTYKTNNGTITIILYLGSDDAVTIPSMINGQPVTRIGDRAFAGHPLTSVTIPNSVTSIGNSAFYTCPNLASVTIPNSITNIGNYAFFWCISLTAIIVDQLNSVYSSVDGVLFKSQTALIQFPGGKTGSYDIPNGVTSIGNDAFSHCCNLGSITIPASLFSIGNSAFEACNGLSNVTIPDSVTNIGHYAFSWCTNLMSIAIPKSVTSIGIHAFEFCTSLSNVTIGNSVTNIGSWAFEFCTSLTNVTIGKSVTSIANWAFGNCTSLTGAYFHGNAPTFGSGVFGNNDKVIVYYLPGTTGWDQWVSPPQAVLWNPHAQTSTTTFGVRSNQFGFTIRGTADIPLAVEASTNLAGGIWSPLQTCTLTNGSFYFSDPDWTNYPARFYRFRSP